MSDLPSLDSSVYVRLGKWLQIRHENGVCNYHFVCRSTECLLFDTGKPEGCRKKIGLSVNSMDSRQNVNRKRSFRDGLRDVKIALKGLSSHFLRSFFPLFQLVRKNHLDHFPNSLGCFTQNILIIFQNHLDHFLNHLDHFPEKGQKQVAFTLKSIKTGIYLSVKTFKTIRIDSK